MTSPMAMMLLALHSPPSFQYDRRVSKCIISDAHRGDMTSQFALVVGVAVTTDACKGANLGVEANGRWRKRAGENARVMSVAIRLMLLISSSSTNGRTTTFSQSAQKTLVHGGFALGFGALISL